MNTYNYTDKVLCKWTIKHSRHLHYYYYITTMSSNYMACGDASPRADCDASPRADCDASPCMCWLRRNSKCWLRRMSTCWLRRKSTCWWRRNSKCWWRLLKMNGRTSADIHKFRCKIILNMARIDEKGFKKHKSNWINILKQLILNNITIKNNIWWNNNL